MKIFPIFKNIQEQKPIVQTIFWIGFVIFILVFCLVTFGYPFYLIEFINLINWRILEIIELAYWLFLALICLYLAPQFFILNNREKKIKMKKKLFENIALTVVLIIGFGLFIVFGFYNIYAIGKDVIEGTKTYSGECDFTYKRSRRSTSYYLVIEDDKKLHISRDNYSNYKSLDYCRVVYLSNSEKCLDIKSK